MNIAIQEEFAFLAEPKRVLAGGKAIARRKAIRKARKKQCERRAMGTEGTNRKQVGIDPHPRPGHSAESVG